MLSLCQSASGIFKGLGLGLYHHELAIYWHLLSCSCYLFTSNDPCKHILGCSTMSKRVILIFEESYFINRMSRHLTQSVSDFTETKMCIHDQPVSRKL